jgi:hypothetical protein
MNGLHRRPRTMSSPYPIALKGYRYLDTRPDLQSEAAVIDQQHVPILSL